jgi:hypothetical protein
MYNCECGSTVKKSGRYQHIKTKKHLNFINSAAVDKIDTPEEAECVICYDSLKGHDNIQLKCSHSFHFQCLSTWFKTNKSCPLCRAQSTLNLQSEQQLHPHIDPIILQYLMIIN